MPESVKALEKLDLLVVADPHPTTWAALAVKGGRKENTYLLPVCTQLETSGSRVASNRSLQWGEQIVKPSFEMKDDRSEEHTSELQSLMRISYAVFCLKKNKKHETQ